jgi:PAS domain S-box-containing protein
MDIRLREKMTGIEAAAHLRRGWDIPVVYLTAYADEALLRQAQVTEPYGYLAKPVRDKELHAGIEMALYKHRADRRLKHLTEVLRAVRDVNQLITRDHDRPRLLAETCQILVRSRDYALVWIGQPEPPDHHLTPIARAGQGQDLVDEIIAACDEDSNDPMPYIEAMRTQRQVVRQNVAAETNHTPGHEAILARGLVSTTATPMLHAGRLLGVLCVHADKPNAFDEEELALLNELAGDLALALSNIEAEARRKQTEEQLRQRNRELERLTAAIEQAAESVIITDTEANIIYVNPAFERITGYSRAEVIGQNPRLLKSGRQAPAFYQDLWSTITAGQVWRGHFINKKKDGTLYTIDATIAPVKNEQGDIVNYVGVRRDITRELQLEEQYRQAQKMQAVGQLTAGIAHDFNNLLTAINGFAELTRFRLPADHALQEMLGKILDSGQAAASLVKQLMIFSRKQVLELTVLDLNTVVVNIEKMLQRIIGEQIILKTALAPDLGLVKVDAAQMEQVIVNLAVNARDAMPNGGRLTIETANVTLDEAYSALHLEVQPGEYVQLAVSDNGTGMNDEVKARLFEPFFTTKASGQGTGLGLATVFGVVKQSRGHIRCYSEVGVGTTFKIYLPCAEGVTAPVTREEIGDLPRGNETILLVEDDPAVRDLTAHLLRQQGYTVLEAADDQSALRLDREHSGPIHLLLTDVVIPGANGKILAGELQQIRPELKVLFMSGYTDNTIAHHGVLEPDIAFLSKPFTATSLTRKVREVLDSFAG